MFNLWSRIIILFLEEEISSDKGCVYPYQVRRAVSSRRELWKETYLTLNDPNHDLEWQHFNLPKCLSPCWGHTEPKGSHFLGFHSLSPSRSEWPFATTYRENIRTILLPNQLYQSHNQLYLIQINIKLWTVQSIIGRNANKQFCS